MCFSDWSEIQRGRPALCLAMTFSTSSLKPLNGIRRNLTESKNSTLSNKFVLFEPIGKTRWPPRPLICWDIFDFFSETTERNLLKLDRKQELNVLSQVCDFFNRSEKQDGLPGLWLADTFSIFFLVHLSRRLKCTIVIMRCPSSVVRPSSLTFHIFVFSSETTEQNLTKPLQEGRSQRPLPSLCFSGRSDKQDGCPGLWLAETFSTSPLKPLDGIQRNLTGSKISKSSTKFVFFRPIGKTRWPPWPLIGWDIFNFSSETAEQNSTKLDRKQDLNVLYQVCVFRADRKNKMAALASDWLRYFRLLLWNHRTEFAETRQEARTQRPLPSLWFF